jgi:hypothetical protein
VWLVYGGRLQYLLSKPLEEVQIEMTNDSFFQMRASEVGPKQNGEKIENCFPIKRKNPQPFSSG